SLKALSLLALLFGLKLFSRLLTVFGLGSNSDYYFSKSNRQHRHHMPIELKIGDLAPDLRPTAVGGKYGDGYEVSLTDFREAPLVLYFYPKDDTPGCTKQVCALRDAWNEIKPRAAIFGVSIDPPESHKKFIRKFRLPFPLL